MAQCIVWAMRPCIYSCCISCKSLESVDIVLMFPTQLYSIAMPRMYKVDNFIRQWQPEASSCDCCAVVSCFYLSLQAVHLAIAAACLLQDNRHLYPACNKVISHLTAVSEELVDVPLYFSLHDVCKTVKCTPPKADVLRSALINAGENAYL